MIFWVFPAMMSVIGVKYYTAIQVNKFEKRLDEVKDGLHETEESFLEVQEQTRRTEEEEAIFVERIRVMRGMLEDLKMRLSLKEEPEEESILVSV